VIIYAIAINVVAIVKKYIATTIK